jgi:hypothetical protein
MCWRQYHYLMCTCYHSNCTSHRPNQYCPNKIEGQDPWEWEGPPQAMRSPQRPVLLLLQLPGDGSLCSSASAA